MMRSPIFFAAAVMTLATAISAHAQGGGVRVGGLTCQGGTTASYVVGSVREYNCMFSPSTGGPAQRYHGVVHRAGVDLGATQSSLGWAVFAATHNVGPGDLAGDYGGVSAGAAIGVGANANALVGGMNNSFALQPVSLEAQQGFAVTASLAGLELNYVAPRRPPVRRHHRRR
jgi:hypothetical protein